MPRVLVVDDDAYLRNSLAETLQEEGFSVSVAEDGARAVAMLPEVKPAIVLTDVRMPQMGGIELLKLVRERMPDTDVVLMTAYDDMPTVVTGMREGAVEFLVKPLDLYQLRALLRRIVEDRKTLRRTERPAAVPSLESLVGRDPTMIDIYKRIGQAACSRATVLIRGESGTGKELIARAIHDSSAAASEPFVAVNCAALPTTLLESELFGHVRGAFTGATGNRRGRFALAGSGTIFLDEIGDTTLEFQTKLLRVLQNREYYPVGAERPERTEARVIAATHRNLEAMIGAREFREDLYYRLRVFEITVPPLRERPADIPLLAAHLVSRGAQSQGTPEPVIAPEAMESLQRREWRGNVRELENTLLAAVLAASGGVIRPEHLKPITNAAEAAAPARDLPSLDDLEREHVERVLRATGGHKARTAEILGISRPTLNRLLEKYGIE